MPKAVASVTSVPTRADYQQQLEANLERKRKREGGDSKTDSISLKGMDKGKRKRGRGAKTGDEDSEYRPKTQNPTNDKIAEKNAEKQRKTRGKPPKKCLADSPEREEPGDLKAESMKYAEAIRAQFDEPKGQNSTKGRKKKRKGQGQPEENSSAKTPRLVIKFSKESVNNLKENGGDEYDFVEEPKSKIDEKLSYVDGTVDSALSSVNNSPAPPANNAENNVSKTVTKLKIKI